MKPEFLKEEYDHLSKQELEDEDFLPDYLIPSKEAIAIKRNPVAINLPWLIQGTPKIEIKDRFMGEQIFSRMQVHKNEVLHHLFKIYRAVLLSMSDHDYEFLGSYCEKTFQEKLVSRLKSLKE